MNRIRAVKRVIKVTRQISVAIFLPEYSGPPPVVVPSIPVDLMYSIRLPTEVSGICGIYGGLWVLDSGSMGLWTSGGLWAPSGPLGLLGLGTSGSLGSLSVYVRL